MRIPIFRLFVIAGFFWMGSLCAVHAKDYPSFYRGARPLGMGNAFTAVADDENALFYNPAGLSNIQTFTIGILNPLVEASGSSIDMLNDAQDTDFDDSGEVSDLFREYLGEHQHLRTGILPHVGFNVADFGVMIAGLGQANLDIGIRNPVWPEAQTNLVEDYGLLTGVGTNIPLQDLRLGAALKLIHRDSLDEVYTAMEIADDGFEDRVDDDLKSGSGVSLDIGAIYTMPIFRETVKTDVALVVQNVPKMDFGNAQDLDTQANLGVAVEKTFAKFSLLGALDYHDVSHNIGDDKDIPKRLHMGVELRLPTILALRVGLSQGYGTLGATLDFWALKLDLATYAEEVGSYAGQREDRRYVAQLTLGW